MSNEFNLVSGDTETTGLSSKENEIVEVCMAEFRRVPGTGEAEFGRIITKRCRPIAGYIPQPATAVHGITYEMVKNERNYLRDGVREEIAAFVGNRPLVGHNIINFDAGFLKIKPTEFIDTLKICREKYKGGNKLKTACQRVGLKWDDQKAHSAEYDTIMCAKLYCKILEIEDKLKAQEDEMPLFAQSVVEEKVGAAPAPVPAPAQKTEPAQTKVKANPAAIKHVISNDDLQKMGIVPTDKDKQLVATQAYSYSRINLFHQCPFKWYMQYIKKIKEPPQTYFEVGNVCHSVAQWSGEWCYRQLFANKFVRYFEAKQMKIAVEVLKGLAVKYKKAAGEITVEDFAFYMFDNQSSIKELIPGMNGLSHLIRDMDKTIDPESYEKPSMPDRDSYDAIIQRAIVKHKVTDPSVINDSKGILYRFYEMKDFSLKCGEISIMEKRLAFNKDWDILADFFANDVFFRGVIDLIDYYGDYVVITDYKSSRTMLTEKEFREDRQTRIYLLLVFLFLPRDSYKKIVLRIEYIRFGKTVEYEVENVEEVAQESLAWINNSIQAIEKELLKNDGTAFAPKRNEFCHRCHIGEDGKCPLFNKQMIKDIGNPYEFVVDSVTACSEAWKRVEANKAENSRLTKECKSFLKACESDVKVDEHAKLDFYVKEEREYFTKPAVTLLLEKGMEIDKLIHYLNLTRTAFEALIEKEGVELTDEEIERISRVKRKTEFKAVTPEEGKSAGYLNA